MTTVSSSIFLDSLTALNDSTRLRILYILNQHELSVGEIADIVQLPQSTVSRHLKLLFEAGFAARRTIGTVGLYRTAAEMPTETGELWNIAIVNAKQLPEMGVDRERLVSVLASRHSDSRSFFKNVGSEWETLRRGLFGSQFTSVALLSLLDPSLRVVDIGCGIGNASSIIAPFVTHVTGVDREISMLQQANKRPDNQTNIEYVEGDATNLPLDDQSVDVSLFCLVLHHIEDVEQAIQEACRVVRCGGRIAIIDMQQHSRDEYTHTLGHVHGGFSEQDLQELTMNSACALQQYHCLYPDTEARGPSLFAAIMQVTH
jgi:ArsR family transcriptional regulator